MEQHEKYMELALKQAKLALSHDEVPIGAVIVKDGKVIARAYNIRNRSKTATAHAEVLAINKACKKLSDWRLNGCDLYVTLEPCLMCVGAAYNARIDNIYFGAYDSNSGGLAKLLSGEGLNTLNHTVNITGRILQEQCSEILSSYFKSKRV